MGGFKAKDHPRQYLAASALAASINYPLWRASAVGQSGFAVAAANVQIPFGIFQPKRQWTIPRSLAPYLHAFVPPYKGMVATVAGMTWARAAIFWGSDTGRDYMRRQTHRSSRSSSLWYYSNDTLATVLPPLVISTLVQCVNMPLVRATITIQNPASDLPNVSSAIRHIYHQHGLAGMWHGTSAGILKTVPKYCTAIAVKNKMEEWLPQPDLASSKNPSADALWRSAYKSSAAGIVGAALTNPLDVSSLPRWRDVEKLRKYILSTECCAAHKLASTNQFLFF